MVFFSNLTKLGGKTTSPGKCQSSKAISCRVLLPDKKQLHKDFCSNTVAYPLMTYRTKRYPLGMSLFSGYLLMRDVYYCHVSECLLGCIWTLCSVSSYFYHPLYEGFQTFPAGFIQWRK